MTKYCLQKEANLINQKYMTEKTAAQNIKNHLKFSTENETIEEIKRKRMHGQFYHNIARPSVGQEKSLVWLYCSGCREKQRV